LPEYIKRDARKAYRMFARDTQHPGLRFKRVHSAEPVYSVRVSLGYRALGVKRGDEIVWFWIGSHTEYERLIRR
jgi:hypothetical protein